MDLRALDDRFVPVAAARLRSWSARLGAGTSTVAGAVGRGLDAMRVRPAVSGLVLAVAVAASAGAIVVSERTSGGPRPANDRPGITAYTTLGPTPGQQVDTYVEQARERLEALDDTATEVSAIVDLVDYSRPADVAKLLEGVSVRQVFFRVKVPRVATRPHTAAVADGSQIGIVIARSAQVEAATAASLTRYAAALPQRTAAERAQRQQLLEQAAVAQAESRLLTADCTCVFGVVVNATPAALRNLATDPAVRVIDPAPAGAALGTVGFNPLPPDVRGTIPPYGEALS